MAPYHWHCWPKIDARELMVPFTDTNTYHHNNLVILLAEPFMSQLTARIASITCPTEAEGPGIRWAVWFQGCSIRCPGCCNPHYFNKEEGRLCSVAGLIDNMIQAHDQFGIEGITLLGGEPTDQPEASSALAQAAQNQGLSVLMFTGRWLEDLRIDPTMETLLAHTDLLVDGPFIDTQKDFSRRWIGSTNQRLHVLSNRVARDDPRWQGSNTVEIRLEGGQVHVNGFPITGHRFPLRLSR